jgi:phosphoglycerate dehydrogenase-like enzyme
MNQKTRTNEELIKLVRTPNMTNEELIKALRKTLVEEMISDILSVQPMPDIDRHELAKSPLWHSFVNRHLGKDE